MRKAAVALGTVGIGAGILYAFGRSREKGTGKSLAMDEGFRNVGDSSNAAVRDFEIDDRGTDQNEAVQILTKIKDEAFDSSDEKLALALGRPVEEIQAWTRGEQTIDSDVLMKARALGLERGLTNEEQE